MPSRVPIFDSCTHPTIDGAWLPGYRTVGRSTFEDLITHMDDAGVQRALAVGMRGAGGYSLAGFARASAVHADRLVPVAYLDVDTFHDIDAARDGVSEALRAGYRGVKIHPRLCGVGLAAPSVALALRAAHEVDLPALVCTYLPTGHSDDDVADLETLLDSCADAKVVLLHGGCEHIADVMRVALPHPHVLVDLSFTIGRFAGGTLDAVLTRLLAAYPDRMCVGSDFPDRSLGELRERFDWLVGHVADSQAQLVGHANLEQYFGAAS